MTDPLSLAVEGAKRLAARPAESAAALAPLRPFDSARMDGLDAQDSVACDAFLRRYENLLMQLQDQVWRQVAEALGDDPSAMSRRDVAERMDRFGLVAGAREAREAAALPDRLAHADPMQPAIQAQRIEAALAATPVLLDAAARAEAWLARRRAGRADAPP